MLGSNRLSNSFMQLSLAAGAIGVAIIYCSPTQAQQSKPSSTVSIELVGDDGLTQALTSSLKSRVVESKSLRLTNQKGESIFVISSETNVNWDTLAGKTVIIYHVQLTKGGAVLSDKVGACFEKQVNKCARDIMAQYEKIILVRS